MKQHLLSRIESRMPSFSKGQKLIAGYIEEHYDKAAFMTASKLGATVGVSESTVVRFATEVGYDGYPELQKAMQEMIRSKLTSVQRMEVTSNRIGDADVLNSVLNQDIDKIRRTMEEISHEEFYNAVDSIVNARKIYILATRSSAAIGSFLGYYFNLIFERVAVVSATSETEIYEQLMRIGEEDVVIGISFPRYSKMAVKAMGFASDSGATVIALTDSLMSPLVPPSNHVLLARSDMASVVDSLVAPLSVVNALIVATALRKKEEITSTFDRLEQIWEQYEVYEKVEENIVE
ncbi:MAG: MurR/RpiR family transcriptional regulator [Clostridiales bacterium]|nr:MurR/RpiR family transcriptional regulator [Clostridiales bacterium]